MFSEFVASANFRGNPRHRRKIFPSHQRKHRGHFGLIVIGEKASLTSEVGVRTYFIHDLQNVIASQKLRGQLRQFLGLLLFRTCVVFLGSCNILTFFFSHVLRREASSRGATGSCSDLWANGRSVETSTLHPKP